MDMCTCIGTAVEIEGSCLYCLFDNQDAFLKNTDPDSKNIDYMQVGRLIAYILHHEKGEHERE